MGVIKAHHEIVEACFLTVSIKKGNQHQMLLLMEKFPLGKLILLIL